MVCVQSGVWDFLGRREIIFYQLLPHDNNSGSHLYSILRAESTIHILPHLMLTMAL